MTESLDGPCWSYAGSVEFTPLEMDSHRRRIHVFVKNSYAPPRVLQAFSSGNLELFL